MGAYSRSEHFGEFEDDVSALGTKRAVWFVKETFMVLRAALGVIYDIVPCRQHHLCFLTKMKQF